MPMVPAWRTLVSLAVFFAAAGLLPSEASTDDDPGKAVLERDRGFWEAYNRCDVPAMSEYFTDDVEFYHDHGGPTVGHENFVKELRDRLCGNPDSRLRRA